ncbi:MAG: tRNA (cytidine(56)-2'-O)-methyltransferase [Candidatus Micrarchaeota archaeon]|nr:tRNA (cytidine(56)-2'-O)-methyltransferase [Candidatus Micrarchaeota archaeon]
MRKVSVLRLGHRIGRDRRITTHVFLAARALGANDGILCGEKDERLLESIRKVSKLWGGAFVVRYEENWKKCLMEEKRQGKVVVHLTMYGEPFLERVSLLKEKELVVVVGAGKVPPEIYHIADFNLAVTQQPHSEVSALALFLDRYFEGKELSLNFEGMIKILPNKCGKSVVRVKNV